jgi:hypothetical protein
VLNQGVKTDSRPIPFDPAKKYRFSVHAKSDGPNCRILLEGYKWRPGVQPHADPDPGELRQCYKFTQLFFAGVKGGNMGGVGRGWQEAFQFLPGKQMTPLQQKIYDETRFVIVHMVGLGGSIGTLYVDDVTLERTD